MGRIVDLCTINGRKDISSHVFNVFKRHLLVNAYVFSPLCITGVLHMYVYTIKVNIHTCSVYTRSRCACADRSLYQRLYSLQ